MHSGGRRLRPARQGHDRAVVMRVLDGQPSGTPCTYDEPATGELRAESDAGSVDALRVIVRTTRFPRPG
jgi:hypothetical protein